MVLVEFLRASRRFPNKQRGSLEFQEFDPGRQLASVMHYVSVFGNDTESKVIGTLWTVVLRKFQK